jgi:Skp family chaperone for outer membrane proteins
MCARKRIVLFLVALVAIGFAIMGVVACRKEGSTGGGAFHMAILDTARIKAKSVPFIKVKELVENEHTKAHDAIMQQEQALRTEYEALKNTKADAAKIKELKEAFDKKMAMLEQTVQQQKEKLSKKFARISEKLETELKTIVRDIAGSHNINLVMNKYIQETQAILYAEESLDITDAVMEKLDKNVDMSALIEGDDA